MKELGIQIPVERLMMHGSTNVAGKTFGTTIAPDKFPGAKFIYFPQAQVVAILHKEDCHLLPVAGIQSMSFKMEEKSPKQVKN